MPKTRPVVFICNNCGNEFLRWSGKCSSCGSWNTLTEVRRSLKEKNSSSRPFSFEKAEAQILSSISATSLVRLKTGLAEFDRAIGGGFVPGQVVLLAGEPGIGKSTLLLQVAQFLSSPDKKVLYLTGEESPLQIKQRAERIGVSGEGIEMLATTALEEITELIESGKKDRAYPYCLLIIDSIQTLTSGDIAVSAGSVPQVKECARRLTLLAKKLNLPVIFIGHVTKEGDIAGPKVLEHIVDTVLYLEGERNLPFRLLKASKNRFGDPAEVGVFEMKEKGFSPVANPGEAFIAERGIGPGTVLTVVIAGNRPLLLEVQALVAKTSLSYPRRVATGFDYNRLLFLVAVAEKNLKLPLQGFDVYVNVTGGVKIEETAADLAVVLAIVSSFRSQPVKSQMVLFGEVGLTGEVRRVSLEERRAKEAKKLGFTSIISPESVKTIKEAVSRSLA